MDGRRGLAVLGMSALLVAASHSGAAGQTPRPSETIGDIEIARGLVYRQIDGVQLELDVYSPPGGPHPAVLLIHGGAWAMGSKDSSTPVGLALAEQDLVVFAIDYRLAPPGGRWHAPAQVEDARAALRWIRANGAGFGADSDRVIAFGASAGGNLALMLATTGTARDDKADVAVTFSAPTDLLAAREGIFDADEDLLLNYIGCSPAECEDRYREVSPIFHVDETDSPIFLANGTDELVPLGQATSMRDALQDAGVPVELVTIEGSRHGRGIAESTADDALAFARDHLSKAEGGDDAGGWPWRVVLSGFLAVLAIAIIGWVMARSRPRD